MDTLICYKISQRRKWQISAKKTPNGFTKSWIYLKWLKNKKRWIWWKTVSPCSKADLGVRKTCVQIHILALWLWPNQVQNSCSSPLKFERISPLSILANETTDSTTPPQKVTFGGESLLKLLMINLFTNLINQYYFNILS